jgi:uncharacterized cofD-like protein
LIGPTDCESPRALSSAVAIGGGTGLPIVLRCLRDLARDVVAVVSVADDGGSSGRLRRELGMLPPGDLRKCLVALADEDDDLAKLFEYRFVAGEGLEGHKLGNLLIAALADIEGDFAGAIAKAGDLIQARGRVLPSTVTSVVLCAHAENGDTIQGQYDIATSARQVRSVYLEPFAPPVYAPTAEALASADLIVIGPGSLYTSIIPNLLVAGVPETIRASGALKVLIVNIVTQPGETDGYTAADHYEAIARHAGDGLVDVVVVNEPGGAAIGLEAAVGLFDPAHLTPELAALLEQGVAPVLDDGSLEARGVKVVTAPLASVSDPVRHDREALCRVLCRLVGR